MTESAQWADSVKTDDFSHFALLGLFVLSSTGPAAVKQGHTLGKYMEEGAFNGRPYFRKQNSSGNVFMYFSGMRWVVSDGLDKKTGNLRNREIRQDHRDSFLMRLFQKVINRIRVKERSDNLPKFGWYYGDDGWKEDKRMVLNWLAPDPCRRLPAGGFGGVSKRQVHRWRDILSLEEAGQTAKKEMVNRSEPPPTSF